MCRIVIFLESMWRTQQTLRSCNAAPTRCLLLTSGGGRGLSGMPYFHPAVFEGCSSWAVSFALCLAALSCGIWTWYRSDCLRPQVFSYFELPCLSLHFCCCFFFFFPIICEGPGVLGTCSLVEPFCILSLMESLTRQQLGLPAIGPDSVRCSVSVCAIPCDSNEIPTALSWGFPLSARRWANKFLLSQAIQKELRLPWCTSVWPTVPAPARFALAALLCQLNMLTGNFPFHEEWCWLSTV